MPVVQRTGAGASAGVLPPAVRALRPDDWVKNLFVLAPLLFAGRADAAEAAGRAVVVTVAFCAVASAGYLLNDVLDVEADRAHSTKRRRAVAAGQLRVGTALALAGALACGGSALALLASPAAAGVLVGYGALTVVYSAGLKRVVVLDVMLIAACFLARVLAGSLAVGTEPSQWLLVCTGMVALLLGFGKRRQEVVAEPAGGGSRAVLEHYSLPFLDQIVAVVSACTLLSYAIYATDSPLAGDAMLATVPAVVYGVLRYLYLVYHRHDVRSTAELVTRDPGMVCGAVAWVASAVVVIYL